MASSLAPPAGFIDLLTARTMLVERHAPLTADKERSVGDRPEIVAASAIREAMLETRLRVFAWKDQRETIELDLRPFRGLMQPSDGTVFTFVYLRPGIAGALEVPEWLIEWLPTAVLLLDEASFRQWLRRKPGKATGRPPRIDALEFAKTLAKKGAWGPTDTPGQLFHLLNKRGALPKRVALSTVNRIAQELGYRPQPRAAVRK